jgi:N-acetylneuraminic acid mutarotase
MRRAHGIVASSVIGLIAVLTGCGGKSSPTGAPLIYSIGGTLSGLATGTVVLQNNGADNLSLSVNGPFTFATLLSASAIYGVSVATQPLGGVCSVANGSGVVGTSTGSITNITVTCTATSTPTQVWTWVGGPDYVNAPGVYGTQGTAAASNTPGARRQGIAWTDASGNFWLFGGYGTDVTIGNVGMLNDLWEYSPTAGQWVWQGGSDTLGAAASYGSLATPVASNNPGAREGAAKWADGAGNLWLFGGDGLAGQSSEVFNDLWEYDPTSTQWTWVGGSSTAGNAGSYGALGVAVASNLPPARTGAVSWVDASGVFWLFGGAQLNSSGGPAAVFNDLWSFNPTTGLWTWVGGGNQPNATGMYGTQGTAAPGNVPGARMAGNAWLDDSGNLWLFGGLGLDQNGFSQEYNDLWEYSGGQWTWVSGSSTPNATGVFGTQGVAAAANVPGARVAAVSWKDSAGNLWLFGGYGYDEDANPQNLNDLWEYNLGTALWTWISGTPYVAVSGTYGTQGMPAVNNTPGAREQAAGWLDNSGSFWLFGGYGLDASGEQDDLNDLWSFNPTP